ncbi:MAG TPA: hypothetical protein VMF51_13105 [Nocardioides sp.]|uniref:hypothetical protein n=1 Tax=Nocardioides sp. TaxID=35761 RepID=UPI002BE31A0D|nr:hypothetical protein [Nocardioides sp.]HTW16066.1 hypothetical protein [Nocardioides sp.]
MDRPGELIVAGSARHAWRPVGSLLLTGLVLGVVFGVVAIAAWWDEPRPYEGFLAVLAFALVSCLLAGAILALVWVLWPAPVRYYVDGTDIVVRRGPVRMRRVDASQVDEIHVAGSLTWRGLFFTSFALLSGMPQVVCVRARPDRLTDHSTELPRVLVWGRAGADAFHEALTAALRRNGVTTPVTRRS